MKPEDTSNGSREDTERLAGEELTVRWTSTLDTLAAKLARHHRDAEQLAEAMRRKRPYA
jgi:hypothetical protein